GHRSTRRRVEIVLPALFVVARSPRAPRHTLHLFYRRQLLGDHCRHRCATCAILPISAPSSCRRGSTSPGLPRFFNGTVRPRTAKTLSSESVIRRRRDRACRHSLFPSSSTFCAYTTGA